MPGGGSKPGERRGGRRPGAKNKTTIEREARAAEGMQAALETGLLPLDVMLRVMRGGAEAEAITDRQYGAAVDAAPYLHPRLTAAASATLDDLKRLSDAELAAELARLRAQGGGDPPRAAKSKAPR